MIDYKNIVSSNQDVLVILPPIVIFDKRIEREYLAGG